MAGGAGNGPAPATSGLLSAILLLLLEGGQNLCEGDEVRGEDITPGRRYSLPTHTINIGRVSHYYTTAESNTATEAY